MKPNIFEFATKELSQDAFLTWLLKWADNSNQIYDEQLNDCAKQFVKQLVSKFFPETALNVEKVDVWRQKQHIDIWAQINDEYLIIIEDKTTSSRHSNQLTRYKEVAEKSCKEKNFQLVCIYIKTGNEALSSLKNVEKEGFQIFNRQDLINVFSKYPSIKNEIFVDFYERLMRLEAANHRYESVEIGKWLGDEWTGFYQYLERKMGLISWGYVSNQSRGFWGAVLNWEHWSGFAVYLQIEQGELCFKISTHKGDIKIQKPFDKGTVRNQFYGLIIKKAKEQGLTEIRKPDRFGNGEYMTSAIIDRAKWIGADTDVVNLDEVIKRLEKYKLFLRSIIA